MANVYAVIMAGGRGERFWPLSTDQVPKPFIRLLGSRTLIQQTVDRIAELIPPQKTFISIGEAHKVIAIRQLPQIPLENFIVEPIGRDTAPCIGYSALHIERRDPGAAVVVFPSDHYIEDVVAYRRTIQKGIKALPEATGVVFGIRPSRPETGYGYIQAEAPSAGQDSCRVVRFVEKPDVEHARAYIDEGNYYWNSGIFLWRNHTLLTLIEKHMPDLHAGLGALRKLIGLDGASAERLRIFSTLPRISIDFGVMEKAEGLRLVPAEFPWDDIGNWGALERAVPKDADGNASLGGHVSLESKGCVTYSDAGTIATFGVSDLVVVQANGKVLVCPKDHVAELKRWVSTIDAKKKS